MIDTAEAARRVNRAREEREALRQVREMHLGQLGLRLVAVPLERLADEVEPRRRVVAHLTIAFEQTFDETGDHLGILLREPFVYDEHVGDDKQVLARGENVRLAAAAFGDLGRLRCPGDAASEQIATSLHLAQEQITGGEGVLAEDEVELVGVGRGLEVGQHVHAEAGLLREVTDEKLCFGELRRRKNSNIKLNPSRQTVFTS